MNRIHEEVKTLAESLIFKCRSKQLKIVLAESMTGGLLASELTAIENASDVIEEGFIVYSDKAKQSILNCREETIKKYSVYSLEVVKEMIQGLSALSKADIKIAISGIAGPKTYFDLPIGQVYIGIEILGTLKTFVKKFDGDRRKIRYHVAEFIFKEIISSI